MDIVYIRDLKIETVIGIYDWEREIKQTVSLDLEMAHEEVKNQRKLKKGVDQCCQLGGRLIIPIDADLKRSGLTKRLS